MKLTFLGAAGEVTGSNYLLEDKNTKILIDCGLFQGAHFSDLKNSYSFKFDPSEIQSLIITHAHIDHSGRVPLLVKRGFTGKIYGSGPTLDLAQVLLFDSLNILKKEAEDHGHEPLFGEEDVLGAIKLFQKVEYDEEIRVSDSLKFSLRDAGHILGSALVEIFSGASNEEKTKIVFSGDLGNYPNPILNKMTFLNSADYLVVESTYGDREHEDLDSRKNLLKKNILETINRGGVLMIPAFAIERAQEILMEINDLVEHHLIPRVPVFVDSPMAIRAIDIYKNYERYYNPFLRKIIKEGDDIFNFPGLVLTESVPESKQINQVPAPKIILAGSGMSNGGRILHHERRYLSDPKNTLLITGYQTRGSLGRKLADGFKYVTIAGEEIQVRASIVTIHGYSAHADQSQLLAWIKPMKDSLKKIFVIHGEEEASYKLSALINKNFKGAAIVPRPGESFEL